MPMRRSPCGFGQKKGAKPVVSRLFVEMLAG